jgi:transposase
VTLLTVKEAAKRVKRSVRTIERWITDGLQVIWLSNVRYISEEKLLAELRERNLNDPSKARETTAAKRRAERVANHLTRKYPTRRT